MSKSVSNDALWEKLSEIEGTINRYLKEQKELVPKLDIPVMLTPRSGDIDPS